MGSGGGGEEGADLGNHEALAAVIVVHCHVQTDLEEVLVDLGIQEWRHNLAVPRSHRVLRIGSMRVYSFEGLGDMHSRGTAVEAAPARAAAT